MITSVGLLFLYFNTPHLWRRVCERLDLVTPEQWLYHALRWRIDWCEPRRDLAMLWWARISVWFQHLCHCIAEARVSWMWILRWFFFLSNVKLIRLGVGSLFHLFSACLHYDWLWYHFACIVMNRSIPSDSGSAYMLLSLRNLRHLCCGGINSNYTFMNVEDLE